MLKNQQEKERLKAQTLENTQPEDNGDNIDDTNSPRHQRSKGKASHSDQIKSSKKNRKMPRAKGNTTVSNDPPPDPDTLNEDLLIGDLIDTEEDSGYAPSPDEIGFYTFF